MNGKIKAQRGRPRPCLVPQSSQGRAVHGQDQSCSAAFFVLSLVICVYVRAHVCRSGVFVAALAKSGVTPLPHVVLELCSPSCLCSGLSGLDGDIPKALPQSVPVYSKH